MDTFITVYDTDNLAQANIIKGHLDSEGIECVILNELTSQMKYGYSSMIGIQIQVLQSQLPEAINLLKESGYITDDEDKPSAFITKLDNYTSKIPILNKLVFGIRISILVAIVVTIIVVLFYLLSLPSSAEIIVKHAWCLDKISYEGKSFTPNSTGLKLIIYGDKEACNETIQFWNYGRVNFPGFNSRRIEGNWKIDGNKMRISNVDTFQNVYDGIYSIDLSENILTLKSDKTMMYCSMENSFSFY